MAAKKKSKEGQDGNVAILDAVPKARDEIKPPSLFKVILHNDDYTTRDFVVLVLCSIFHKSETEAVQIMLQVHQNGSGVAGVYPFEIAETKAAHTIALAQKQEFPLKCSVEKE